jgi:hypothetical protein
LLDGDVIVTSLKSSKLDMVAAPPPPVVFRKKPPGIMTQSPVEDTLEPPPRTISHPKNTPFLSVMSASSNDSVRIAAVAVVLVEYEFLP